MTDVTDWKAEAERLRAERDAAQVELERVQARGWPSTPEDVRALLGSRCGAVRYALPVLDGESEPPPDISDTYTVSAHDLITCNIAASEMRYAADVELERLRAELAQAREALHDAREMLIGDPHLYRGQCPQPNGTDARDPECPACATLCRIDAALAAKGE